MSFASSINRDGHASPLGHFHQAVRIRTVRRTHNQNQFHFARQRFHGFLAVLRRVADVVRSRPDNRRESAAAAAPRFPACRKAKASSASETPGGSDRALRVESTSSTLPDDDRLVRRFARRAHNFLVIAMSDQNQRAALARKFQRFQMDFRDQRAGGVNHAQIAILALLRARAAARRAR